MSRRGLLFVVAAALGLGAATPSADAAIITYRFTGMWAYDGGDPDTLMLDGTEFRYEIKFDTTAPFDAFTDFGGFDVTEYTPLSHELFFFGTGPLAGTSVLGTSAGRAVLTDVYPTGPDIIAFSDGFPVDFPILTNTLSIIAPEVTGFDLLTGSDGLPTPHQSITVDTDFSLAIDTENTTNYIVSPTSVETFEEPAVIPEPSSVVLWVLGVLGFVGFRSARVRFAQR